MKAFFTYFFLAGGAAFILMFAFTFLIHLLWSPYTMGSVIGGAIGCGLGTGLYNGVIAAFNRAG